MMVKRFSAALAALSLLGASALWSDAAQAQCVSLTTTGVASTQNFDTLANSGSSSTLPTGWAFLETLTNANTTYTAGTGSATSGDTYSFGMAASTERAFGGLQSGTLLTTIGACFTNNTGGSITALDIGYTGEQWRLGTSGRAVPDRIDFQYSLDATTLSTGTWLDVNSLDFVQPLITGTVGALDGNAAGNRTLLGPVNIPALSIANGATFWIPAGAGNIHRRVDGLQHLRRETMP